ncbi:unnamed protein product [Parnassius apollo]|uniref:(apollo) hypothetical protein n=1 Tax=Parnassius apollo TaxID=110799 RepID=A0A8S3X9X7_PARAO|nr:unnamed protein product [Parnassius apollo]
MHADLVGRALDINVDINIETVTIAPPIATEASGASTSGEVSGPRYRENTRTYKDKNLQRLEQVRKKLNIMFIEPDETLSDKGPEMTSFQSTSETVTAGNNMEMIGPINNDQQQQNYSQSLLDTIFSGSSGPTLELTAQTKANKSKKSNHTADNMLRAIELYRLRLSIRKAAEECNVCHPKLRYLKRKQYYGFTKPATPNYDVNKIFTDDQEKVLEEHIRNLHQNFMDYPLKMSTALPNIKWQLYVI